MPESKSSSYPPSDAFAWIIGWGQTELGNSSIQLKNAKILIHDTKKCSNVSYGIPKSWQTQICAGK